MDGSIPTRVIVPNHHGLWAIRAYPYHDWVDILAGQELLVPVNLRKLGRNQRAAFNRVLQYGLVFDYGPASELARAIRANAGLTVVFVTHRARYVDTAESIATKQVQALIDTTVALRPDIPDADLRKIVFAFLKRENPLGSAAVPDQLFVNVTL